MSNPLERQFLESANAFSKAFSDECVGYATKNGSVDFHNPEVVMLALNCAGAILVTAAMMVEVNHDEMTKEEALEHMIDALEDSKDLLVNSMTTVSRVVAVDPDGNSVEEDVEKYKRGK